MVEVFGPVLLRRGQVGEAEDQDEEEDSDGAEAVGFHAHSPFEMLRVAMGDTGTEAFIREGGDHR